MKKLRRRMSRREILRESRRMRLTGLLAHKCGQVIGVECRCPDTIVVAGIVLAMTEGKPNVHPHPYEAHDTEHAVNGDAGGIGGNEDDALLLVGVGVVRVRLAHGNVDLAARVTSTRGPPFLWKED